MRIVIKTLHMCIIMKCKHDVSSTHVYRHEMKGIYVAVSNCKCYSFYHAVAHGHVIVRHHFKT